MDKDSRKRMNRMMLFFVLVSIALIWSWSQVGQRQLGKGVIEGEDIVLLHTERGCDLAKAPCAAYLKTYAVVASASAAAPGVTWRVKLVGEGGPELPRVELQLLEPGEKPRSLAVLQAADQWQAMTRHKVKPGTLLRVYVRGGELPLVADFPVVGDKP